MSSFLPPARRTLAGLIVSFTACVSLGLSGVCLADQHTGGVPELSSRPGAEYTIYLNVAGFNYDGEWRDTGKTPGTTLALNDKAPTDTFTAAEQEQIKNLWARVAQSYVGFNVNVTTVDPAVAAGQAATDAQRQAYYDTLPNFMHTVVGSQVRDDGNGGQVNWYSDSADGVSGLGVMVGIDLSDPGSHTNWMFSEAQAGAANGGVINGDYIGAVASHENGHAMGLYHQGDWKGGVQTNEYSNGDTVNTGIGSYVPIMGNASDRQRVTWRVGDTGSGPGETEKRVSDIEAMLAFNNAANAATLGRSGGAQLRLVDDGIGRTSLTATTLPLDGTSVDTSANSGARGVIVPESGSSDPLGESNYTEGWFSFTLDSTSTISLTVHNSTDFLEPGVADGVGTLRSKLNIFDFDGITLLGTGSEDASTLFTQFDGTLDAGSYFAQITSFGGHTQDSGVTYNEDQNYFDMGAYFLTGSGFTAIPEPEAFLLLFAGFVLLFRRCRSRP